MSILIYNTFNLVLIHKLIFVIVFLSSFSSAQEITNYGLKVGINASIPKLTTKNFFYKSMYRDSRLGSSIGIFTDFSFNKFLSINFDISYSNEGAEDKIPITTFDQPYGTGDFMIWDHEFGFLNTKICLKPIYEFESLQLYALIGPELKFLLYKKDTYLVATNPKNFLLGYNLGFGFLPKDIFGGRVFMEFRFSDSFGYLVSVEDFKFKFHTLLFSLGCKIN